MPRSPRPRRVSIVRYETADGKRCAKDTPGAVKHTVQSETWYWCRPKGCKPRRVPLAKNEGEAWNRLRELLKRANDERLGIRDSYTDAAELPLAGHIAAWVQWLADQGRSEDRRHLLETRVLALAKIAGWQRITDIEHVSCQSALAKLEQPSENYPLGLSAQTRNHYLAHVKQFAKWLWEAKRLREPVLALLRPVQVLDEDRRHDRRCLTDPEVVQLFEWLEAPEQRVGKQRRLLRTRKRMTGPHRCLLYQTAMATGFRAGELRSLSRESFDLDASPPTVAVEGGYSKHRRRDVQVLPTWLVAKLRAWFDAGGDCWQTLPEKHTGFCFRRDVEDAGIAYALPGPAGNLLYADLHSLRAFYLTALANQGGISPKTLMTLARHADPRLTLAVYAKARIADLAAAVNQIPEPGKRNVPGAAPPETRDGSETGS